MVLLLPQETEIAALLRNHALGTEPCTCCCQLLLYRLHIVVLLVRVGLLLNTALPRLYLLLIL